MQYTLHRKLHVTDTMAANTTSLAQFRSFPNLHRATCMQSSICQQKLWFHSTRCFLPTETILQDSKLKVAWTRQKKQPHTTKFPTVIPIILSTHEHLITRSSINIFHFAHIIIFPISSVSSFSILQESRTRYKYQ